MRYKKIGVKTETFVGTGRYQHKQYNIGINAKNIPEGVSDNAVRLLEKTLEQIYEDMPEGSKGLTAKITYKIPNKKC